MQTNIESHAEVDYLKEMALFVVPITTQFLTTASHARDVELKYATEHNIPILPIMIEQ